MKVLVSYLAVSNYSCYVRLYYWHHCLLQTAWLQKFIFSLCFRVWLTIQMFYFLIQFWFWASSQESNGVYLEQVHFVTQTRITVYKSLIRETVWHAEAFNLWTVTRLAKFVFSRKCSSTLVKCFSYWTM